jgi:hypothetical protein
MHWRLNCAWVELNPDVPAVPAHPTTAIAPDVLIAIIAADTKAPASNFRHPSKFSDLDMRTPLPFGAYQLQVVYY